MLNVVTNLHEHDYITDDTALQHEVLFKIGTS
jgi:hypothetical protein